MSSTSSTMIRGAPASARSRFILSGPACHNLTWIFCKARDLTTLLVELSSSSEGFRSRPVHGSLTA
eukprot:1063064-Amphidinium_carterae.1